MRESVFDAERMGRIIARQDEIYALQPKCPECGTEQVQVTDKFSRPAKWRCRMCKTPFVADTNSPPALLRAKEQQ